MILGQTKSYILGIAGMLIISVWSPNKLAYTEPFTQCCDVIDNSLVFNSTILKLSAQYDSTEQTIVTKAALVDSQSKVINRNLKKLKDDNSSQVWYRRGWNSGINTTYSIGPEELQNPSKYYLNTFKP